LFIQVFVGQFVFSMDGKDIVTLLTNARIFASIRGYITC
jgi:hypothetical protein